MCILSRVSAAQDVINKRNSLGEQAKVSGVVGVSGDELLAALSKAFKTEMSIIKMATDEKIYK